MSAYSDAVLADAPLAYWRLNEASGLTAVDYVGAHTGTLNATGVTVGQGGALLNDVDSAMGFDGTNGQITVSDTADLRLNQASWSVESWFYINTLTGGTFPMLMSKGPGSVVATGGWQIYVDGSLARLLFKRDNNQDVGTWTVLQAGVWYHMVYVYDGSTSVLSVYLNGVRNNYGVVSYATNTNSNQFIMAGSVSKWVGRLDEVAIYPSALSPARVAAHYTAVSAPVQSGTVSYGLT